MEFSCDWMIGLNFITSLTNKILGPYIGISPSLHLSNLSVLMSCKRNFLTNEPSLLKLCTAIVYDLRIWMKKDNSGPRYLKGDNSVDRGYPFVNWFTVRVLQFKHSILEHSVKLLYSALWICFSSLYFVLYSSHVCWRCIFRLHAVFMVFA